MIKLEFNLAKIVIIIALLIGIVFSYLSGIGQMLWVGRSVLNTVTFVISVAALIFLMNERAKVQALDREDYQWIVSLFDVVFLGVGFFCGERLYLTIGTIYFALGIEQGGLWDALVFCAIILQLILIYGVWRFAQLERAVDDQKTTTANG